ncbi:GNAT family N-acetyltransferase [Paracoccus sp. PAR01]|uniref:GNAT family N-acetyltransferase n=1 Tax=Paracoccus sp. PAR01 TaxID=2769282 RepID=UPI00177B4B01|nr:GNAT family N-acetyltransferase [Paracoccus sp. PAR01]MBD9528706.1 GNAT family N-acetyltransferase [Paracoccus sp. PAR01]
MRIEIRPAETRDIGEIFHVRTSVTENVLSHAELAKMGITAASIAAMIESDKCAWVAADGDNIVGFSMIDADEGSLFAAFVLPSHEGMGVGRRLVEAAEAQLFSHHAVAWLETGEATRAAGFYRHLGWGNAQEVGDGDIRLEKRRP